MVLAILPELLRNFEIIHQCGEKNFKEVKAESEVVMAPESKTDYHLFPFLEEKDLKHAYEAAELIVSRSGSGSVFEIAAVGKPSILIPLSTSAQNHQVKNAYSYAENGASLVMEEANLTPHFFLEKLKYLFNHPAELEKMNQAATEFSRPKTAAVTAEYLLTFLGQ
jgi:UDP-N-acetylglucosamine--N-acetylmuramyl-(pentapeptide) pyrophosphoryl-undecaprenol N-acetylglucosamine transferase